MPGVDVRSLVKAELHVHLEGTVEPMALREIEPSLSEEEIRRRYSFHDFAGFLECYKWATGFLRGPAEYALIARRFLETLARQNARYAEINLSVGVMLLRKLDADAIYDAVRREAARQSAVEVRFIFDAIRHHGAAPAMQVARLAVERAGDGVAAFGIGGDELRGPAQWFGEVFRFARENGLKLAPHAGETAGPESVWAALELGADRIGHGIRSIEDPRLIAHLRDRRIPLEVCITSNLRTGSVRRLEDHPVARLFEAGVPIVLNTDDPAMFGATLNGEYEIAARVFGFGAAELERVARNGFEFAFTQ
jgi:aminodeoxyfutalosine deaminase